FNYISLSGMYASAQPGKMALVKYYIFGVLNLESYRRNIKPKSELIKIEQKHAALLMAAHMATPWKRMFPFSLLLKWYCGLRAKWLVMKRLENVNKAGLRSERLPRYYSIPFKLRIQLVWTMVLSEYCAMVMQLFISAFR